MSKTDQLSTARTDRRDEILAAALSVFSEKGFEGAAVKEIAHRAGVAPGLLYHYFESKEDLLFATLERYAFVPELCCAAEPEPTEPIDRALERMLLAIYHVFKRNEALMRVFISEAVLNGAVNKRWGDVLRHGSQHLGGVLQEYVKRGELRSHDTNVAARLLLHSTAAFSLWNLPESAVVEVVRTVLDGIRAPQPGPARKKSGRESTRRRRPQ
jgi:AcrR family transcriptional regulator